MFWNGIPEAVKYKRLSTLWLWNHDVNPGDCVANTVSSLFPLASIALGGDAGISQFYLSPLGATLHTGGAASLCLPDPIRIQAVPVTWLPLSRVPQEPAKP